MDKGHILIVEDDPGYIKLYRDLLGAAGHMIDVEHDPTAGLQAVKKKMPDLVLLDLNFNSTPQAGLGFITEAIKFHPDLSIIIISAQSDSSIIMEALDLGAVDYIVKDHSLYELLPFRVNQTLRRVRLERQTKIQLDLHSGYVFGPGKVIIGKSSKMVQVYDLIEKVAWNKSTVLILGESGTGKELVAQAIHARKGLQARFASIDCGAVPKSILESELFGVRANYPGFHNKEPLISRLETAGEGTLLLDEIGNMDIGLQASLLRVLEERQFTPLGCSEVLPLHAQVVASTNLHFESAIQSGKFREDLYYRLNEVPILLPSLRERKEDIPLLVRHFLDRHKTQTNSVVEILPEALEKLISYNWPGNVRELAKVIHRALTTCQSQYLTPKHFDFLLPVNKSSKLANGRPFYKEDLTDSTKANTGSYKERMTEYQKVLLLSALEENGWNQTEAARKLGLNRAYFSRLVNALDLRRPQP